VKRIVVIGSGGQDGRILTERLLGEGHQVLGVERTRITGQGIEGQGLPAALDVTDAVRVREFVGTARPDELYYLAAHHHASEELDDDIPALLGLSQTTHVTGLLNMLEAVRRTSPRCRTFYAASSHVFGIPPTPMQDESTPLAPRCIYGITKTAGIHVCRFYRQRHGLHVSVGILYNHESRYRPRKFVSQRIVQGALEAREAKRAGRTSKLVLGDLSAVVDWGYAPDYVDAAIRMVTGDIPDDFVVATGIPHTVGDFVATAFGRVGLEWREHVEENPALVRRQGSTLVGNSSKLRQATGWKPSVGFEEMIGILLQSAG
jgi:GDPmannose 4,6-dehydratase